MFYKILLSAALTVTLTATTASAQCASGGCGGGIADGVGYVGQDYFAADVGDCGCGGGSSKYARFFGGVNYLDSVVGADFRDGWGAGFALGRRNGNRRGEVELSYRDNDFSDIFGGGNVAQTSNMYNVLFDIDRLNFLGSQFYAGGGIGLTHAQVNVFGFGDSISDTAFSYQAIAGLSKKLRGSARGFIEYRYLASEFDFGFGDVDINNHDLFIGLEFNR